MLILPINKNRKQFSKTADDFHRASAHNPIFQIMLLFLGCPYCSDKAGRRKNFKTLWKLYMHIQIQHRNEKENFKSVIWNLADYVIRGVLQ